MKRRELIILVAALVGRVLPASAQQTARQARLGWLAHGDTLPRHFFDDALAKLGWIEGKNLTIERRFSGVSGEELEVKAAELVAWQPDVIVALGIVDAKPLVDAMRGGHRLKARDPPVARVGPHCVERLVGARHALSALVG
jgi:hypothetical protein